MAKQPTRAQLEAEARPEVELQGLPEGFLPHKGGKCPVDGQTRVVVIVRTAEGLGFAGPVRALEHEWEAKRHKQGVGAVVGYREAAPDDLISPLPRRLRWSE